MTRFQSYIKLHPTPTKHALILAAIAVMALVVTATGQLGSLTSESAAGGKYSAEDGGQNGDRKGQRAEVPVEQITIWSTGITPAEITRPSGPVALVVINNSGVQNLSLQLNQETGARVREARLPKDKREWREYVELAPGNYVITEAGHPNWFCRLNINGR